MSGIYDDQQQALAYEVENYSSQGTFVYKSPGAEGDPFNAPTEGTEYAVKGWNRSGQGKQKYIEGGYIVASDVLLSVVPFGVVPTLAGTMSINGVAHQIVLVDPATLDPDNPVVWRIGCRK